MELTSLFGTLGSWFGGFVSHLLALVFAPLLNKVRDILIPVPPPAPPPFPPSLEASIVDLAASIRQLGTQIDILTEVLRAQNEARQSDETIRALPRPS